MRRGEDIGWFLDWIDGAAYGGMSSWKISNAKFAQDPQKFKFGRDRAQRVFPFNPKIASAMILSGGWAF
jgi:hypothetical protein